MTRQSIYELFRHNAKPICKESPIRVLRGYIYGSIPYFCIETRDPKSGDELFATLFTTILYLNDYSKPFREWSGTCENLTSKVLKEYESRYAFWDDELYLAVWNL